MWEVYFDIGHPELLNFVVFGTITFSIKGKEYECKDMRMGQEVDCNWWIAAPYCFRSNFGDYLALNCSSCPSCGLTFQSTFQLDHFEVQVPTGIGVAAQPEVLARD